MKRIDITMKGIEKESEKESENGVDGAMRILCARKCCDTLRIPRRAAATCLEDPKANVASVRSLLVEQVERTSDMNCLTTSWALSAGLL